MKSLGIQNRIGTKGYMAPEAILFHWNQNGAIDIWSCGCIFLQLLAGKTQMTSITGDTSREVSNFNLSSFMPLILIFGQNAIKSICLKLGSGIHIPKSYNN